MPLIARPTPRAAAAGDPTRPQAHLPLPGLGTMFGLPVRLAGIVLAVTLTLICVVFALLLWSARVAERQKAETAATNLTSALTQHIARNVELYDETIKSIVAGLADPTVMSAAPAIRQRLLFDRVGSIPFVGSIVVEDEHGNVRLDSASLVPRTIDYADRAYFQAHRSRADLGLVVSEPVEAKSDHSWVVSLSRRVNKPDGSFGGVVSGTLRLDYFHVLFAHMNLGPKGSLTLSRTDGTILMREPFDAAQIGRVLRPGSLFQRLAEAPEGGDEMKSLIDGVDRLFHYQQVPNFPLVQFVALSIDDIYADWWRKAIEVAAVLAMALSIITLLALTLRHELRRRVSAEAALLALASEDGLTGLANRRRFDEVIGEELRRASRYGWPLTLMMVDVDHFKAYNDSLGHPAGDKALIAIAACLNGRTKRSGELAARYGGEEFAMVFPHMGAKDAVLMADLLLQDVLGLGLPNPGSSDNHLSISIGIASLIPAAGDGPGDLIEAADAALYTSKAEGRNRATLCETLEPGTLRPAWAAGAETEARRA